MTETGPLGSLSRLPAPLAVRPDPERYRLQSLQGRPVPGIRARVVDLATGRPVPWDGSSIGELEVRGAWVADGYYGDPAGDRIDDGWLRTGDVATIDQYGFIRLVDRAKDLVKSGGEWISSVDLENELMGHPGVVEAAVVGVPDERWGERPVAFVVVREGTVAGEADLRAHLAKRFPKWWLPDEIVFVQAIPKTSVGKFDKKTIRARGTTERGPGTLDRIG